MNDIIGHIHPSLESLAVPVDDLELLPGNPRVGDIEAVARSYASFGQRKPIVARRQGESLTAEDYEEAHGAVAYGWKPDGQHRAPPNRKQDSVWAFDRPKVSKDHPTQKPVALIERALWNSSDPGAHVLDPFGGSGSTLIACERYGRVAHLVELDRGYADVICRRYQEHTGTLPIRESTGAEVDFTEAKRGSNRKAS